MLSAMITQNMIVERILVQKNSSLLKKAKYYDLCISVLENMINPVNHSLMSDYDIILNKIDLYSKLVKLRLHGKYRNNMKLLDYQNDELDVNIEQIDNLIKRFMQYDLSKFEKYKKNFNFLRQNIQYDIFNSNISNCLESINVLCDINLNIFYINPIIPFKFHEIIPKHYKTYIITDNIKSNMFNIKSLISKLHYFYDNNIGYCSVNGKICRMYKFIYNKNHRMNWLKYIWIAKSIIGQIDQIDLNLKISLNPLITKLKSYIPDEKMFRNFTL
jgi:hypothetical protein